MKLGIAHFSFVTNQQSDCEYLANETLTGPISCVYDSGEIKNLPEWVVAAHLRVWFQRIRFIARTIRLGFNVMLVDADTMFFSDPYV